MSGARSSWAWTCHWTPFCCPGWELERALAAVTGGASRPSVWAKVPRSMIAAFEGGCAGAGPTEGLSGWKTLSGAVISATPVTV